MTKTKNHEDMVLVCVNENKWMNDVTMSVFITIIIKCLKSIMKLILDYNVVC